MHIRNQHQILSKMDTNKYQFVKLLKNIYYTKIQKMTFFGQDSPWLRSFLVSFTQGQYRAGVTMYI